MKLILLTIVLMAIVFALIGIKMFLKKGGEFKKQCSSAAGSSCSCESSGPQKCENYDEHHSNTTDKQNSTL